MMIRLKFKPRLLANTAAQGSVVTKALTGLLALLCAVSSFAQKNPADPSTTNGILTLTGTTKQFIRFGPHTGGGELFWQDGGTFRRHSLAFSTDGEMAGADALVDTNNTLHVVGVLKGKTNVLVHLERPNTSQPGKIFGNRTYINPKGGENFQNGLSMTYGSTGYLEVFVPMASGGIAHFASKAVNGRGKRKFTPVTATIDKANKYSDVAIIQTTYTKTDRFEGVVRRNNGDIYGIYQDGSKQWNLSRAPIVKGTKGRMAIVERDGKLDLIVGTTPQGELQHWQYDSGWKQISTFKDAFYEEIGLAVVGKNNSLGLAGIKSNGDVGYFEWMGNGAPPRAGEKKAISVNIKGKGTSTILGKRAESVGIHATLLGNGKLLTFGYSHLNGRKGAAQVYNPNNGSFSLTKQLQDRNLFCSGHTLLPNGNVFVAGGHTGISTQIDNANTYLAGANRWVSGGKLAGGKRWYPTVTVLQDGRVLITAGASGTGKKFGVNNTYEFADSTGRLEGAAIALPQPFSSGYNHNSSNNGAKNTITMYPFVFQLPNGKVAVHSGHTTRILDLSKKAGDGEFTKEQYQMTSKISRNYPTQVAAVLGPLDHSNGFKNFDIIAFGAAGKSYEPPGSGKKGVVKDTRASNIVESISLGAAKPVWKKKKPMKYARVLNKAVYLPTGEIMVFGGSGKGYADNVQHPVAAVEVYNPQGDRWSELTPLSVARLYHSTGTLMPDGSIVIMGTDQSFNLEPYKQPQLRVETYKPPYMEGARPNIGVFPATVKYNDKKKINGVKGNDVRRVSMIRTGSSTHAFDMNMRYLSLQFTKTANSIAVTMPPNGNVAPPGYYMLYIIDKNNKASIGRMFQIGK